MRVGTQGVSVHRKPFPEMFRHAGFLVAFAVLLLLALCGCGALPEGVRDEADLQTPEEVRAEAVTALVDGYLKRLRPDGQIIVENRWVAPSAAHVISFPELSAQLPALLPETLDAFRLSLRSPADWTPLAPKWPRCQVLEEREALGAYAAARVTVGPYAVRETKHELMISLAPVGVDPGGTQALVYLQEGWMDGRVERRFLLLGRGWVGWGIRDEWRFG